MIEIISIILCISLLVIIGAIHPMRRGGYTFGSKEDRNIQPPKTIKPKCVSFSEAGYQD